jgi:diacylglycerol kinase family enzyme
MGILNSLRNDARYQNYTISADGKDLSGIYSSISIFNGGYTGDTFSPCPEACPNDGILDAILIKKLSVFQIMTRIKTYLNGNYRKHPEAFSHHYVHRVTVKSDSPLYISLDGEIFYEHSLDIKIIPNAIRFVSINGLPYSSVNS